MKRLYVRSHTPRIVLVAALKDGDEKDFQKALLCLSIFPLQAFLYETQKRELYGDELRHELTTLISYAKKNKKEFWYCDEEDRDMQQLNPTIGSLPTVGEIWQQLQKTREKQGVVAR